MAHPMETHEAFVKRVDYQERRLKMPGGYFHPDQNRLFPKIDEAGRLRPFYGDTVVYDLDEDYRDFISSVQDRLYAAVPGCFAERLPRESLHMTLHDLSAAENLVEAAPLCFENEVKLARSVRQSIIVPDRIQMRTNFIIHMVDTSLVMSLLPHSKEEWDKLERVYRAIDAVRECPFSFLTPHITLAYYRRDGFDEQTADALRALVWELNGGVKPPVVLRAENLYYKKFVNMGEYIPIFRLG